MALVFWSAKKCPSCLAETLCLSGLSDPGERLQSIKCHLPPCPSSYCPQREGRTTFQSSCAKACVHWKTKLLLPHLVLFWFHVSETPCAVGFHFLCKAPLTWTPAGRCVLLRNLPLPRGARGSNATCAGERSASRSGICVQRAVQPHGCCLGQKHV